MTLLLAALSSLVLAAPPTPVPRVWVLPGDLEVVVVPVERADTASLRYVVRSGAGRDPAGKDGLAHLLEHLLVRDAKGPVGLVDASKAAGATLNAYTSRETTTYVLDAPAAEFERLAAAYLRAITDPPFAALSLQRELGVIASEAERAGGNEMGRYLEDAIFRQARPEGTTLGERATRNEIVRKDLLEFFQRNYATSNTTLVFTGAVTEASVRALLERAFLLAPALPGETLPPLTASPNMPITEKLRAPFIVAIFGYQLRPEDHAACEALASLVELRLLVALKIREPLVDAASVECETFRGSEFLMAVAYAPTLEASDLPQTLEEVFRRSAAAPTLRERQLVEARLERLRERTVTEPARLADAFARAAAGARRGGRTELPRLDPRRLPLEAMGEAARRSFRPERRFLLLLSPFEG